jgi:tetratricopeptide (TPR) repeat protein
LVVANKKCEVSNLASYASLIADQKKRVRQNPGETKEWLKLGRLCEDKIDLINYLAKRDFLLRNFLPIYSLLISMVLIVSTHQIPILNLLPWQSIVLMFLVFTIMIVVTLWIWSLRYPLSGKKYFKKAIALDSSCGEAYLYLGLIALRRHQKRKACRFLEQATRLNVDNSGIKRELKSIYEKEFFTFFNWKTEKEIRQEEIIDSQLEQIKELRSRVSSLDGLNKSLSGRVEQAKWEAGHKAKALNKEMQGRIATIRGDYEERIAVIKQDRESREEEKELAARDFVRLTTEIMEEKAKHERRSFEEASRTVEDLMGSRPWQAISEQTKSYLATAEHIFCLLAEEDSPDYSMVGIEMCKALETEINRTLVEPFLKYLDGNGDHFLRINKTGEKKRKPFYFTYLAKVVDRENFPEVTTLTLGQYHFVLDRTISGEQALREYRDFLDELCCTSSVAMGRAFLKKLETLTKRYRNTIVHQSLLNRKECEHLRELIFVGEDALLRTCCSIQIKASGKMKY